MTGYLFLFLPFFECIVGTFLFAFKKDKSFTQLHFMMMIVCLALYLFADGVYLLKDPDYKMLVYSDILSQFISPAIPFAIYIYIRSMFEHTTYGDSILLCFIPGIIMALGAVALYFIIGIDESANFLMAVDNFEAEEYTHPIYSALLFWTDTLYTILLSLEIFTLFIWEINLLLKNGYRWGSLSRFFVGKGTTSSNFFATLLSIAILLINGIRLVAGRTYLIDHPIFSYFCCLLNAILIAASIDIAYWYKISNGYITEFQHRSQRKKIVKPELLLPTIHTEQELDSMPMSRLMFENCGLRIYNLFEVEKAHMKGSLSIKEASDITGLSTRTINATISSLCQCNFKDMAAYYINRDILKA